MTERLANGGIVTGGRTNETQLRLIAASFISPRTAVLLSTNIDVRARGGALNRTFTIRFAAFF